jgi:RNA polymerase sigma factor (TIGR02999 family)
MTPQQEAELGTESVSDLLPQLGRGNQSAEARLIARVYPELRRLAANYLQRERPGHTLQPTALVNEAFVRLAQHPSVDWQGRAHFFAVAARIMRRILVDHARMRTPQKPSGGDFHPLFTEATVTAAPSETDSQTCDFLAIHEALERLSKLSARQSTVVELSFFGGLSFEEIATVLDVSERTVKRDWAVARAWLHAQLDT